MIHPTRRAVALFAGVLPISWLLLLFLPAYWLVTLYASFLVLLAIALDALFLLPRHLLDARLSAPPSCFLGEPLELAVEVSGPPHRRPTMVDIRADLEGTADACAVSGQLLLAGGTPATCRLGLRPRLRGVVHVASLTLGWRGRLGLVAQARAWYPAYDVQVLPNTRAARRAVIEFFARESMFGMKVQREKGGGTEFEALREYVPGLDSRSIDWKHSARHCALVCKELRAERNHHVVLGFDTGYLMQEEIGGLTRLDHAINAALVLSWIALDSGDLVGSYAFDSRIRHYAVPCRGARAYQRIQHAVAELPYTTAETNFAFGLSELQQRLTRRSLVFLLTEFVDTVTAEIFIDNVQHLSARHVVVFVTLRDPFLAEAVQAPPETLHAIAGSVIAGEFMRDRSMVLERLKRLGIHCIDVDANQLSMALLNRYLLIKQRELI